MFKLKVIFVCIAITTLKSAWSLDCERSINIGDLPRKIDTGNAIAGLASRKRIAEADLKKIDLKSSLEFQSERLSLLERKVLNAGNDITRIVDIINEDFQARLLVLANGTISVDVDIVGSLIERNAVNLLARELKENLFVEFAVLRFVQNTLRSTVPVVRTLLQGKSISVSDIEIRLQDRNPKFRTCSLNIIQIIVQLIRLQVGNVLVPIQTIVISAFTSISDYVLTYYISSTTNPILASITECTNSLVLSVSTAVLSVQETVNVCFNYIIYGTSTGIDTTTTSSS